MRLAVAAMLLLFAAKATTAVGDSGNQTGACHLPTTAGEPARCTLRPSGPQPPQQPPQQQQQQQLHAILQQLNLQAASHVPQLQLLAATVQQAQHAAQGSPEIVKILQQAGTYVQQQANLADACVQLAHQALLQPPASQQAAQQAALQDALALGLHGPMRSALQAIQLALAKAILHAIGQAIQQGAQQDYAQVVMQAVSQAFPQAILQSTEQPVIQAVLQAAVQAVQQPQQPTQQPQQPTQQPQQPTQLQPLVAAGKPNAAQQPDARKSAKQTAKKQTGGYAPRQQLCYAQQAAVSTEFFSATSAAGSDDDTCQGGHDPMRT